MTRDRLALLIAASLAAGALPACESSPQTSEQPARPSPASTTADLDSPTGGAVTDVDGFRIAHDDWRRLGYRWDWSSHPFVSRGGRLELIEPAGDMLIVQDSSSFMSVLESRSGRVIWTSQLGGERTKFVGANRDADVVLSSSASELFELGLTTGNLISRSSFDFLVDTPPALVGNFVIYGSASGKLLAHNRDIGLKAWAYALNGPVRTSPVVVDNRTIGVVSDGGDVIFLNSSTGSSLGRDTISAGVAHAPLTDGYRLYVASLDQSVYAFDAPDAALAWRVRTEHPITQPAALNDGRLFVQLRAHGLTALDAADGSLLWRNADLRGYVVAVHDNELIVWDGASIAAVDPERGDVITRADIPGASKVIADGFVDGQLYVVTRSGAVIRFMPR